MRAGRRQAAAWQLGYEVIGSTLEQLKAHLQSEIDKWSPVIKGAGIRIQ
jgi:tripartite-type tricarboxylate transporter receptor subunit TctC